MLRLSIVAACIYCWGTPGFDKLRPPILEQPLKRFSNDINHVTFMSVEMAKQLPYTGIGRKVVLYRQQAAEVIYAYFGR